LLSVRGKNQVTICPCCGFKFVGTLIVGCEKCGARAVGEALPKPAHELPSYGRALVLVVSGSLLVLIFAVQTIIAMVQRSSGLMGRFFQFWSWIAAGETAAWRLKWVSIPVLFITIWAGSKLYRSIRLQPQRFCGLKYARRGLLASSMIGLLIAMLIGITVPARLRQRQMSIEAGIKAQGYALQVALEQYKKLHKRFPDQSRIIEDLASLPDPDGIIAIALKNFDSNGYQPRGEVAAVDTQQGRNLRGAIIRKASLTMATDDTPPAGLAFTDYDLRLPGEDKILGNDDDWVGRDGIIIKLADVAKGGVGRSVSAGVLNP
jgi:hypothetical protein